MLENPLISDATLRPAAVKKWINKQTISEEGFTSLHFATFHGNMKMIKYLIGKGADYKAVNRHKINMMHVAAQGDQPAALAYYKTLNLDVNSRDSKLSSPLHWACYAG